MSSVWQKIVGPLRAAWPRPRTAAAFLGSAALTVVLFNCAGGRGVYAPGPMPHERGEGYYPGQNDDGGSRPSWVVRPNVYVAPYSYENRRWIKQRQNEINARIIQDNMEKAARSMRRQAMPPAPGPAFAPPPPPPRGPLPGARPGPQNWPENPNGPWTRGRMP